MKGYYQMRRLTDEIMFNVDIPEFELIVPHKLISLVQQRGAISLKKLIGEN